MLLGSQVSSAATMVVLGFTTQRIAVLALVALLGLTSNTARPAFSAMTTDIVAPKDRVRAFSLNYWAINLGFAVAPVLGGLLSRAGYLTLFLADAATTLVFALLVFLKVPESRPEVVVAEGEKPGSMADVLKDRVFLVLVGLTFLFALVFMQHLSSLPVQMGDDGLTASQYGGVIALNGVLIVLVTVPVTRWLQAYPSSQVLAVSSVFIALGFGATAWASSVPTYALTLLRSICSETAMPAAFWPTATPPAIEVDFTSSAPEMRMLPPALTARAPEMWESIECAMTLIEIEPPIARSFAAAAPTVTLTMRASSDECGSVLGSFGISIGVMPS